MDKIEKLREINKQVQEMCANYETKLFIKNEKHNFNQKETIKNKTIKQ